MDETKIRILEKHLLTKITSQAGDYVCLLIKDEAFDWPDTRRYELDNVGYTQTEWETHLETLGAIEWAAAKREVEEYEVEIFQWWHVEEFFAKKLAEQGQPVTETEDGWVWGRTCCGQGIVQDAAVQNALLQYPYIKEEVEKC